jgi:hypothetical protein
VSTAPLIEYTSEALEQPADRLLRRIVAWTAIVCGGEVVIGTALHIALAKKWVASPSNMSWEFDGRGDALLTAAQTLAMCGLLFGGLLLLRRARASIVLMRGSVVCSIVLTFVSL